MKPHLLENRFRRSLLEQARRTPDGRILAALSGGMDSVVLLHLLHLLAPAAGLRVTAAHLNHGLRGAAADADQRFCESLCDGLGVALIAECRPVERAAGESPQESARRVRYAFLREAAALTGAACIATGHHADDQVETVLWRLATGADPAHLSGMAARSGPLWRPLLGEPRAALAAYLRTHELPHVEDASNQDLRYTRNRIRHRVVPELAAINRALTGAVSHTARGLAEDDDFLHRQAARAWDEVARADGEARCLNRAGLAALHPALVRRLVRRALQEAGQAVVHHRHVGAVIGLLNAGAGRQLDLSDGVRATAGYEEIRLSAAATGTPAGPVASEIALAIPGDTPVPWAGVVLQARLADPPEPGWTLFDRATFSGPLTVRPRRPGDLFHPDGMHGHAKKLKDFLIDARIPRGERGQIPLLVAPEGVLWVVGMRQDARFMVKTSVGSEQPALALRVRAAAAVM
ncbi:MAG: tRNA lysidine(34) synthetase TilS [Nitrospirota bacterium]|nr:tRNA lysidine(34) synthetase TilS [Nitrospirota bacterium]